MPARYVVVRLMAAITLLDFAHKDAFSRFNAAPYSDRDQTCAPAFLPNPHWLRDLWQKMTRSNRLLALMRQRCERLAQGKGPDTRVRGVMTAEVKYCFRGPCCACGHPVRQNAGTVICGCGTRRELTRPASANRTTRARNDGLREGPPSGYAMVGGAGAELRLGCAHLLIVVELAVSVFLILVLR
jgi:hypothetical protein